MALERLCFSPAEFAEMTGLSLTLVYQGLRAGTIPRRVYGRRILIPKDAATAWLATGSAQKNDEPDLADATKAGAS